MVLKSTLIFFIIIFLQPRRFNRVTIILRWSEKNYKWTMDREAIKNQEKTWKNKSNKSSISSAPHLMLSWYRWSYLQVLQCVCAESLDKNKYIKDACQLYLCFFPHLTSCIRLAACWWAQTSAFLWVQRFCECVFFWTIFDTLVCTHMNLWFRIKFTSAFGRAYYGGERFIASNLHKIVLTSWIFDIITQKPDVMLKNQRQCAALKN